MAFAGRYIRILTQDMITMEDNPRIARACKKSKLCSVIARLDPEARNWNSIAEQC